jgi:hypothetical protein
MRFDANHIITYKNNFLHKLFYILFAPYNKKNYNKKVEKVFVSVFEWNLNVIFII